MGHSFVPARHGSKPGLAGGGLHAWTARSVARARSAPAAFGARKRADRVRITQKPFVCGRNCKAARILRTPRTAKPIDTRAARDFTLRHVRFAAQVTFS